MSTSGGFLELGRLKTRRDTPGAYLLPVPLAVLMGWPPHEGLHLPWASPDEVGKLEA